MDFGKATFVLSRHFNEQVLIFKSQRNVGFSYTFHKKGEQKFACASCKKLGKGRSITVKHGRIIGKCLHSN